MKEQIKSKKRVADHGEVFTSEREVNAMLDLVKEQTQQIETRFLEPACGDGNFLAEILRRKLEAARLKSIPEKRKTPNPAAFEINSFTVITSIYGIDILEDNVLACRDRLYRIWDKQYKKFCKKDANDQTREAVRFILSRNIVCGNALTMMCVDQNCQDTEEPIVFSEWSFIKDNIMMQRMDYTFEELVNRSETNAEESYTEEQMSFAAGTSAEPDPEGKFLKRYVSYYRSVQDIDKTNIPFVVSGPKQKTEIGYPVTPAERKIILRNIKNGNHFQNAEGLYDLYDRMKDSIDELLEENAEFRMALAMEPDSSDYTIDFGNEEDI